MKQGKLISLAQTTNAAIAVQRELYQIGLWYEDTKLFETKIYWTSIPFFTFPSAAAIFTHSVSTMHKFLGFEEGHIYIPKWILAQGFWQNRGSLRDIIRHEYGHGVAHYYPELIVHSPKFEKVFGGNYYDYTPSSMNRASYISEYATTMPCEDFAETFMVYVRRRGTLPLTITDKMLIQKWNFISSVCKDIPKISTNKT